MSLILDNTLPKGIRVKTWGGVMGMADIEIATPDGDISMSLEDFCALTMYVLTNTDLKSEDPRLDLIRRIKRLQPVSGWGPLGTKRLEWTAETPAERLVEATKENDL